MISIINPIMPLCFDFTDYQKNYQRRLESWKNYYPSSNEEDFLDECEKTFINTPTSDKIEVLNKGRKEHISAYLFFILVKFRLKNFCNEISVDFSETEHYITFVLDNRVDEPRNNPDGYILLYEDYIKYSPFMERTFRNAYKMSEIKDSFYEEDFLVFSERKFKNFQFAKKRIFEFIEQRREEIKQEKLKTQEVKTLPPTTQEVTPTPIETKEIESLSEKQINVIGLMKLAGFDKFLREKNPNITDSQIAKFYVKINSCDKMNNHESIRPHLTTDLNSKHHPFYKTGKKEIYETILRQYGISPQANE